MGDRSRPISIYGSSTITSATTLVNIQHTDIIGIVVCRTNFGFDINLIPTFRPSVQFIVADIIDPHIIEKPSVIAITESIIILFSFLVSTWLIVILCIIIDAPKISLFGTLFC